MNRLLLLGCSERKRSSTLSLPAIDLYDGPAFRTLRKYLTSGDSALRTVVLSSKYGLIEADDIIESYDRRLNRGGIAELEFRVREQLAPILREGFSSIFISLGTLYMGAVRGALQHLPVSTALCIASGPPGVRTATLAKWLRGGSAPVQFESGAGGDFRVGGVSVLLSRELVLHAARGMLNALPTTARCFHSWSVVIDGEHV